MSIPDYISPIVGYRVWRWDANGAQVALRRAMVLRASRWRRDAGLLLSSEPSLVARRRA